MHPVRELVISDTEQLLHGRVTTDAVHTLIFFQHLPSSPKINFALFFVGWEEGAVFFFSCL